MSEVIRLMNTLAQAPAWFGRADYEALVDAMDVDQAQRDALVGRDVSGLIASMGLSSSMFCMIMTPDGQDSEEEFSPDDDAPERDQPDKDQEPG
jgi:hypothetical protein